jgi:glycosyltransferase involved in cell wall biosynthesis
VNRDGRRILLLITDLEIGGTPTVVRELARRLNSPPETVVDVACLSAWGPVADQVRAAGVRVFPLNARGTSDVGAIARLGQLIRVQRYDTVFSFLVHANVSAAAVRPFVHHVRFIQSIQTTQPYPRWHWAAQSIAHHAADRVVVPSSSVAAAAEQWADIPRNRISVISNAIDPAEFAVASKVALETQSPVPIGFIGRLDPIKRIPDLLGAIANLGGRVHLHLFGEGSERANIERRVAELRIGKAVTLHGAVPCPQAALSQIAMLVLPSSAEGFGLVLIEAMAAGIPVIGTNVPGIRDVIRHNQTGLLVPAGNPEQLRSAIETLIDNRAMRERFIAEAKEDVSHRFTWDAVLPRYRELLDLAVPQPG